MSSTSAGMTVNIVGRNNVTVMVNCNGEFECKVELFFEKVSGGTITPQPSITVKEPATSETNEILYEEIMRCRKVSMENYQDICRLMDEIQKQMTIAEKAAEEEEKARKARISAAERLDTSQKALFEKIKEKSKAVGNMFHVLDLLLETNA